MSNGNASDSMNGYIYQRLYAVYLYLTEHNIRSVQEEEGEDIKIVYNDDTVEYYQIKYRHNSKSEGESLTYNSGIYKTIYNNYTKNVNKIKYITGGNGENKYKNIKQLFDDEKYEHIGKLFIIVKCKNNENNKKKNKDEIYCEKLHESINSINVNTIYVELQQIFNDNYDKIKKSLKKEKKIFNFFTTDKCKEFLGKFEIICGPTYNELCENIREEIHKKYFNDGCETDPLKIIKCENVLYKITELLQNKMFDKPYHNEINYKDIDYTVKKNIMIFNDFEKKIIKYHDFEKKIKDDIIPDIKNSSDSVMLDTYISNSKKIIEFINTENIYIMDKLKNDLCTLMTSYKQKEEVVKIIEHVLYFMNEFRKKQNDNMETERKKLALYVANYISYNQIILNDKENITYYGFIHPLMGYDKCRLPISKIREEMIKILRKKKVDGIFIF